MHALIIGLIVLGMVVAIGFGLYGRVEKLGQMKSMRFQPHPIEREWLLATRHQEKDWIQYAGRFRIDDGLIVVYDTDGTRLVGFETEENILALADANFVNDPALAMPICPHEHGILVDSRHYLHVLPASIVQYDEEFQVWLKLFKNYLAYQDWQRARVRDRCLATGDNAHDPNPIRGIATASL